jgi:hypothetical protein
MFENFMAEWGLPVFGLAFAAIGYLWLHRISTDFDRRYKH